MLDSRLLSIHELPVYGIDVFVLDSTSRSISYQGTDGKVKDMMNFLTGWPTTTRGI